MWTATFGEGICPVCGKNFVKRQPRSKYCPSLYCYQKGNYQKAKERKMKATPTPQHKDTTLDDLFEDWGLENWSVKEEARQALLQWRDKAVVEALESTYEEQRKWMYEHTELKLGYATYILTIVKSHIAQLKETPYED